MDQQTSVSGGLQCGACQQVNSPAAQYCVGCGHTLFEPCVGCGSQVTLTQKFCIACGKDLSANLEARRQTQEERLAQAVEATKTHRYDKALSLLEPLTTQSDYRFADLAESARQAAEKIQAIRQRISAGAEDALRQGKTAFERGDYKEARRLLEMVPPALMDPDGERILAKCRTYLDRVGQLHHELQGLLKEKQYREAGQRLEELVDLVPENEKYRKLAKQVGGKLVKRAEKKFDRQDYSGAMRNLHAVPTLAQDREYRQTRSRIETVEWLAEQFPAEPFATPGLGRLAVRYAQEVPDDPVAAKLVRELSQRVKQQPADPRLAQPEWRAVRRSWLGCDVGVLGRPQSIRFDPSARFPSPVGQFAVAFGLALQGLGVARLEESFGKRRGLLASFGGQRRKACWGIDIGASGIKAVLLRRERADADVTAVASYLLPFETPLCRPGGHRRADETIRAALEEMLSVIEIGDASVWVNLPAQEIVSRFVHLPPVAPKQAVKLLETEAKQRIPIAMDELELIQWLGPLREGSSRGRPAFIGAATKRAVQRRLDQLQVDGLRIAGMQADPLALVNFADYEFSSLWDEHSAGATPSGTLGEGSEPAVALIDAGCEKTSLLLVSRDAFWYWTHESGGEDLTTVIARPSKKASSEAEELKRNPALLERPGTMYEPVENKQIQLRQRLKKLSEEAMKEHDYFHVVEGWCVGKACLSHGWIRRVLLGNETTA